jgi:hypothetical protein
MLLSAAPSGIIAGIVRDSSGAVVRSAAVTAANREIGARRSTRSSSDGTFLLQMLPPGDWDLDVDAAGFERARVPAVRVGVDQRVHVEVALQVAGIRETAEVHSSTAPAEGEVIPRSAIEKLPLNGRQYLDLALLAPGIIPAPPGTQGLGFNVAGSRSQSNVYLLDGVSNQDTQNNGALNAFRLTEVIQEFDVQTSSALPEFGRGSGAQVNVVTRGGSNQMHGSVFEYQRNTALGANDFFTNKLGGETNPLNRNQFGASLGGPVARDRTFFFASYEGFRQAAHVVSSTRVPSAAERASVTDPISQRLLDFWPQANAAGTLNYISDVRNQDSDNTGLLRVDHRLAQNDQLAARWIEYRGTSIVAGSTPITGGNTGDPAQRSGMIHETHTFSALLLNDFTAGFSSNLQERAVQDSAVNAAAILQLPGAPASGLPSINITGGYASLGSNQNFPQGRYTDTAEISDNVAWRGMRFGIQARREDLRQYLERSSRGTITFSSFANFARGLINSATYRTGGTLAHWRKYPWALYWQDQVQLRPNLTLDFGVRYEYPSVPVERDGRTVNFVPGVGPVISGTNQGLTIDPALTGAAALKPTAVPFTLPSGGVYPDRNNFAPMAGVVWSQAGFVVRAGFRLSYDEGFGNLLTSMALAPPFSLQTSQTANVTQPSQFGWALAFNQNVPLISNYGRQGPGTPVAGIITFQGIDPHLATPYVEHYDLTLQRAITPWLTFDAAYHGSSGHKLGIYLDLNQPAVIVRDPTRRGPVAPNEQIFPYPQWGQAQVVKPVGNSNYNGVVVAVSSRPRKTGFAQVSWTLGKSLDYNSSYFGTGNLTGEPGAPPDSTRLRLEHGPSSFDVRSRFVALYGVSLRGWEVYGIAVAQSGMPFTVVSGNPDSNGFNQSTAGVSPDGGNRPDLIISGKLAQDNRNPDAAFDTTAFAAALAGRVGTSGRNQYYGPALVNFDIAIGRRFRIAESAGAQIRAEFFNVMNHADFANPVADMSNASFGRITQTLGSAASNAIGTTGGVAGAPRVIQLSLRVQF